MFNLASLVFFASFIFFNFAEDQCCQPPEPLNFEVIPCLGAGESVNVILSYNFLVNDIILLGVDPNLWTFLQLNSVTYNFGIFNGVTFSSSSLVPGPILINPNLPLSPVFLSSGSITRYTVGAQFMNTAVGGITSPLVIDQDPYYGSGMIGTIDYNTGLVFEFIITNTRIYALYSRLPLVQNPGNNYHAFTFLVPIGSRSIPDVDLYTIEFDPAALTVSYVVNDRSLLTLTKIGLPLDRKFQIADYNGVNEDLVYPASFVPFVGVGIPWDSGVNSACQGTIFDQCDKSQTIWNARSTRCIYAPIRDHLTFQTIFEMTLSYMSISTTTPRGCACARLPCPAMQ